MQDSKDLVAYIPQAQDTEAEATNPRHFYDYAHELYARYNFIYRLKQDRILDKTHALGLETLIQIYDFIAEHLASANQSLAHLNISPYNLPWDSTPSDLLQTIYKHSKRVGFYDSAKIIDSFTDIQAPLKEAQAYLKHNFTKRHYQEIHQMRYFTQLANAPYAIDTEASESDQLTQENKRKDFLIVFYALMFYLIKQDKAQEHIDYIFTEMDRILHIPQPYTILENRSQTFTRSRQVTRYRTESYIIKKWWSWFKWHYRWAERQVPYQATEYYQETIYYMQEVQYFTEWRRDRRVSHNPPSAVYKIQTLSGAWVMSDTRANTSAPA